MISVGLQPETDVDVKKVTTAIVSLNSFWELCSSLPLVCVFACDCVPLPCICINKC